MDAHQIGQQLRAQVLRDHAQGRSPDPRRLQSLVADLCGAEQQALIAPLRHLLLSAAFASAAGMEPPLADGRQRQRLQDELSQLFAPPVCERLQPLLDGLVGRPATSPAQAPPMAAAAPESPAAPAPAASARAADPPLNTLLAFLSGVLLMALAGLGLLAWQRQSALLPPAPGQSSSGTGSSGTASPPPQAALAPAADQSSSDTGSSGPASSPPEPSLPPALPQAPPPATSTVPPEAAGATTTPAAQDRAVASLQQLYAALSAQDFDQALTLFSGAAADQFSPGFFRQFKRVSLQDLRLTSQTGSTLNLEGVVTFVWPDGSVQRESRSFSVDTRSDPAQITASEFGRVIDPRR